MKKKVVQPVADLVSDKDFRLRHITIKTNTRESQTVVLRNPGRETPTIVPTYPLTDAGEHYQAVGAMQRAGVTEVTLFEFSCPPIIGWGRNHRFTVVTGLRHKIDMFSPTMFAETGKRVRMFVVPGEVQTNPDQVY